jgi:hypothetical protein
MTSDGGASGWDDAFVDLSDWRKISVSGRDALSWLDGLVAEPIAELAPGRAHRTLLHSPSGDVIAEFTVSVAGSNVLLLQDPGQQDSVMDLLAPRVGSADVSLEDRSSALSLFSFPGRFKPPEAPGVAYCAPSCLGSGVDLVALMSDRKRLVSSLSRGWRLVTSPHLGDWRGPENAAESLED